MTGSLARPPLLPRGTVAGLSAPAPNGNLASLFPVVTPAPPTPGAGKVQAGLVGAGAGADTALAASTGVIGTGSDRLTVLLLTLAAGIAAFGAWLTLAGPARRLASSLARRRGR